MMRLTKYMAALVAFVALSGCEKELDFAYRDIEPLTVIEGCVTGAGARVSITLTTPMNEPMNRTRLTDATVTLTDLTTSAMVELTADDAGYFACGDGGVAGHIYRLDVSRNGATYTATSTMQTATEISAMEFQWMKMPYDDVAVLQVTFDDDMREQGECYWVRLYRNGEPYKWSIVTDLLAVDGRIDEVLMTSRRDVDEEDDDTVLRDGDVVTASVSRISRAMYDYLEAIGNGTSNGPRMFDGGFCLGYFLASPVSECSIVFRPDDLSVLE
ncbi:MAG: DUF4249 domain-containing protein [Muribaculaceae bacterium]|nr:DUF4249 domain-containing protein [Muribaculaceae bacterium]